MPPVPAKYVRFSDKLTAGLNDINKIIQENKQTLDAVQDIGLELTNTVSAFEQAAVRYIKMIDGFFDTVVPVLKNIPLIPANIVALASEAQTLAQSVLDACTGAEKIIADVQFSLNNADVTKLKAHTGDLQNLSKNLQAAVAKLK